MPPEVEQYLADLVAESRRMLGGSLLGLYAAGSLALHSFQPGRSDIDVALVTVGELDQQTKHQLVAGLRHETLPVPARGLELVVYSLAAARSGTPEPGFEVELNTGPGMAFRATHGSDLRAESDGRFWYALDRSILHDSGLVVVGPPAGEVFSPIDERDLRRLLIESLDWWMALPLPDGPAAGAEDAVLGACRAVVRVRTGQWMSKDDAGRTLAAQGWHAALIERSIAARRGATPPDGAAARKLQREARRMLLRS